MSATSLILVLAPEVRHRPLGLVNHQGRRAFVVQKLCVSVPVHSQEPLLALQQSKPESVVLQLSSLRMHQTRLGSVVPAGGSSSLR